ncbi:uncharacterized protein EI90DRAFT_3293412 [Cantharellus anzutake]|uniref:uncharacterized protein n=1 Tax=Cantharellus anzutake TaxID=1750568 RepID=UPI001905451B|nr:uncharacterized protein EI90DRAFT_3293412 [Cantharellus anzutake]KAF8318057.1 hypothetical protein EI90DRAFT_3293412 [Cantharellus anzutake]
MTTLYHLVHEHPPNSFKYLKSVRDDPIAQDHKQTAIRLIKSQPKFQQFEIEADIYLCLEPMGQGVERRRMLEDAAKNPSDSDKVQDFSGQGMQQELMVVFSASLSLHYKVFEELRSSYKSFLGSEVVAYPGDSPKVVYDHASAGSCENLALYQLPDEDYAQALVTGQLGKHQIQQHRTIACPLEQNLRTIGTSNLIFVFTAKRPLQIPYALFDGRSNPYQFVHGGSIEATSEDPVKLLHEEFRRLMKPKIPLETDDYRIHVYEPREALQLSILKDLKLDDDSFVDESYQFFNPGEKLSKWEHRTLLVVFQPEILTHIQRDTEQRILDDCPGKDKLMAPISLLYQPFGYFRDIRCGLEVPGEKDFPEDKLKEDVNALANEMTKFFNKEDQRRSKFMRCLEPILKVPPNSIKASMLPSSRKISDGHLDGEHGAMVICIECKNELSSASCEPNPQLASYIATSFAKQAEDQPELFQRWRVPALGVTLVGPAIQFFGVIWIGQVRVVPLTPSLPMIDPTGEEFRWDLLLAFKAAALVSSKIKSDIKDFLRVLKSSPDSWPCPLTIKTSRHPSVTEIDIFPKRGSEKIQFILESRFDDFEHRHLYHATLVSSNPSKIFVKFSQLYSKDLHAFCALKGLAPRIFGFQQLHGGWYAVAMESIDVKDHEHIKPSPQRAQEWKENICNLVNAFHGENLVHGDLRLANFVFTNERMLLVDFDWGGEEGKAKFPHELLIGELGVSNQKLRDRLITKKHDQECLSEVLKWVDRMSSGQ